MAPSYLKIYLEQNVNWDKSIKLTLNDKIIGCWLFGDEQITNYDNEKMIEDLSKYKNKQGIEGVAFLIKNEYRNKGYAKKLLTYINNLKKDYDYIWGQHLNSLKIKDFWIKNGRRVVAEYPNLFLTLMDFK